MAVTQRKEEEASAPTSEEREIAISLQDVTVAYRSYKERPTSLKESVIRLIRRGQVRHFSTFDAVSHVSLEVPRGRVLGIIGSNGSGKSTLLKVLAGVLRPSTGSVAINGTVTSLIELGAGFDSELTAVENIYLNGSLHKKTKKEIADRVAQVLEFSELTEFANTPVKYYSSGMYARLGFAVAIDINPDILLVDEILAVGDARFHKKCEGVFEKFLESGKTVVLVSHSMSMLEKTADEVAVLSCGKLVYCGDPKTAIKMYMDEQYQTALA